MNASRMVRGRFFGHVVFFLVCFALSVRLGRAEDPCAKIVSLAPSVTEVLFELGLGDKLVGVTRFCRYPPEAKSIHAVGGFYDVSPEHVALLKPTRVFALTESGSTSEALRRAGISVREVDHTSVTGIRESIQTIARECGVDERAQVRLAQLRRLEEEVRARCLRGGPQATPRRTLVVVGRTREGNTSSGLYISGRDGFYSDVLTMVGAINVNTQSTVAVPAVSKEGLLTLNPEVVVEIVNVDDVFDEQNAMALWNSFPNLAAVRDKKVFLLHDDFASVPGPRYILLAQKLSGLLCRDHPEG